ncbi:pentapeptide repeat-containing protein [Nocardia sp. BMG51109]|uniref:pentapeptide repeat-containing protein n=1 Tax=Nocardia sp. BMG51109 TaxID=1056816 RepID=UPI0004661CA9|nr:pentapeptide repeat-containing protein [Nocardia sp. BMG51109]
MRHRGWFGERLSRRVQRSALLLSVVAAVLGGLAVAALTWWLLWWLLGAKSETPNQVDLTKIALSVTAGIGGAVALVVAYRRQRDSERARFAELFGAAARQLGDADVAVRIAGVYAMAGVADEFRAPARRQQCIDVLCGYLRLPYEPDAGSNHLVSRIEEAASQPKVELHYQFRQNDREVRRAIVDVIVAHLRPSAEVSWSDRDFDFADAVLEDADFRYAVFAGERAYFARSVFTGSRATTFEFAKFAARYVSFRKAVFRGRAAYFRQVEFAPRAGGGSEERGTGTTFEESLFESPVYFDDATFGGRSTRFTSATFSGGKTGFAGVRFDAETTAFDAVTFDGAGVGFDNTDFAGTRISFAGARFYSARTTFDGAKLGGKPRWRRTGTETVDFTGAEFHGTVSFTGARFEGAGTDFSSGDFFGDISFRRTKFAARETRFDNPRAWVGVAVDWDEDPLRRPAHLSPQAWPPIPAEPPPVPTD